MTIRTSAVIALATLIIGAGTTGYLLTRHVAAPGKTSIDASQAAVVIEMRQLGRLETSSFTIEKVIEADKNQDSAWSKFLFGDKLLLIAHGEVVAGIDLSGLTADDMTTIDGHLHLKLPAPQILSVALDNEQTRVYDRSTGVFSRADKDLETQARQAATQSIRDAACQSKILETASDNAKKQIKAMLGALGFDGAVIEIPAGSC